MAAVKLELKLNKLLSKNSIDNSDVLVFIKELARLTKALKHENSFQTYAPIVKKWIGAYETIFSGTKVDASALKYLSKTCGLMTEIFLTFMPSFNQHEPNYNQELYTHWKQILSRMAKYKRARSFIRYTKQFKTLVEYMRTAKQRYEQLAMLDVLRLYTESVPSKEVDNLKELYNQDVIEKLIQMNRRPTVMNRHAFLHDINATSRSIISLKPTKIICDALSMNFNTSSHALWIDFNLRDNSVIFVAVPLEGNFGNCFAVVTAPKLKEKLSGEHVMMIRGKWSVLTTGDPFQKKSCVTVYLPIYDRNAIWKAKVKSVFPFVPDTKQFNESVSQDTSTEVTDQRLKRAVNDSFVASQSIRSQMYESDASSSITGFGNDTSLTQLLETSQIRQPANAQPMPKTSTPQELNRNQMNYNSILTEPNYLVGDGKQDLYLNDSIIADESLTEIMKKAITPIVYKQLDNDNEQQCSSHKTDECNDLEKAKQLNEEKSRPANDKHLNESVDVSDVPIALHLIEDCNHSSGISFCNDVSIEREGSYDYDTYKTENRFEKSSNEKYPAAEGNKSHVEEMTMEARRTKSLDSRSSDFSQKINENIAIHETDLSQISEESFSPIETQKLDDVVLRFLEENSDLSSEEMWAKNAKVVEKHDKCNDSLRSIIGMTSPTPNSSQKQNESDHSVVQSTPPILPSRETSFATMQRNSSQNQPEIFARLSQATPEKSFAMLSPVKVCQTQNENQERSGKLNESTEDLEAVAKSPIRNSSQKQDNNILRRSTDSIHDKIFAKMTSPNKKPFKVQVLKIEIIKEVSRDGSIKSPNDNPLVQEDIEMSEKPPILDSQEPYNPTTESVGVNNASSDQIMNHIDTIDSHSSESIDLPCANDDDSDSLSSKQSIMRTDRGTAKRKIGSVDSLDDGDSSSRSNKLFSKSSQQLKKPKTSVYETSSIEIEKPLKKTIVSVNSPQYNHDEILENQSKATTSIENLSNSGVAKKWPIYASQKMKVMQERKIAQMNSLPSIVNVEEIEPMINNNPSADNPSDYPKEHAIEYQIKKCNDVRCDIVSLVNKLNDLMKNDEICELHRGLVQNFIAKLQTQDLNSMAYVDVFKLIFVEIKSICHQAQLDMAKLLQNK